MQSVSERVEKMEGGDGEIRRGRGRTERRKASCVYGHRLPIPKSMLKDLTVQMWCCGVTHTKPENK